MNADQLRDCGKFCTVSQGLAVLSYMMFEFRDNTDSQINFEYLVAQVQLINICLNEAMEVFD